MVMLHPEPWQCPHRGAHTTHAWHCQLAPFLPGRLQYLAVAQGRASSLRASTFPDRYYWGGRGLGCAPCVTSTKPPSWAFALCVP